MRRLNRRYRGKDSPTDVLSFPMEDLKPQMLPRLKKRPYILLGDIVICPQRAEKNIGGKKGRGLAPLYGEIRLLLVHGLLHLLGFDHERGGREEERMKKKERELLDALKELD